MGWSTIPLPIIYFVPFCADHIQMSLFLGTPSGSPKTRTFVISNLWMLISFSNQVFFKSVRTIFYSLWKYLSYDVYHTSIKPHLTPIFKGFVVGNQIPNLTLAPSFDHNSCKLGLNEQCKGTLSIYASWVSNGILRAQFGVFFPFSTKALNIHNFHTNATPKVEVHLGIIGLHSLHFPSFVRVCFALKHTLDLMALYASHFVTNPMLSNNIHPTRQKI